VLLATVEPRQAEALAHEVLRRARGDDLAEAASVAERALALSSRELLRVDDAHRHLRRAISIAEGAELPVRAAEARLSLALEHIHSGHPRAAWHELSRAESGLAANHPRLHNQVAIVLGRLGHYDDALHAAGRAVAGADDSGNTAERAMTHGNRGLVHAYRGSFADAERDLATARELFVSIEDDLGAFDMLHNLGWLAARQGDLPAALERMDVAEQGIAGLGVPLAVYQLDRVEVLLAAGLHDEATATSTSAAAELLEAGMLAELPDVLLLQSRAALASGDVTGALTAAERAQTYLLEQERPGLAVLAEAAALRALVAGDSVDVRRATVCAEKLTRAGRLEEALELKVVAGEAALRAAEPQGLALLEAVATQSRSRVARHRAFAAQAAVALHRWHGRPSEALVAAQAGLRALEDVRATFGATELRVSTAGAARAITGGAVELALEQGRPALERGRSRDRVAPPTGATARRRYVRPRPRPVARGHAGARGSGAARRDYDDARPAPVGDRADGAAACAPRCRGADDPACAPDAVVAAQAAPRESSRRLHPGGGSAARAGRDRPPRRVHGPRTGDRRRDRAATPALRVASRDQQR
jgi:tetratricopeptide (TPR) repeat protein